MQCYSLFILKARKFICCTRDGKWISQQFVKSVHVFVHVYEILSCQARLFELEFFLKRCRCFVSIQLSAKNVSEQNI